MHALDLPDPGAAAIDYLANLSRVLDCIPRDQLARAIDALLAARACGRRIYVFGNGGSAATASHFVCDLVKTAQTPGFVPFRAFSMTDNIPLLTAWANDDSYAEAFARMVESLVEPDDVVIGISASGNSPNVVNGLAAANRIGATTIALLGFDGGAAMHVAQIVVHVAASHYGLAEDAHSAIGHAVTDAIRRTLQARQGQPVGTLLDEAPAAV